MTRIELFFFFNFLKFCLESISANNSTLSHTGACIFAKRRPLAWSTDQRNPCTDARPTETCVAPVDASRDFFFLGSSSVGGEGALPDFFF